MSAAVDADVLLDVPVIIVIIDIVGIIGILIGAVVVHVRLEDEAQRGPFNADDCWTLSKRSD
jgi:xanthosine utilization system XapX-like protein